MVLLKLAYASHRLVLVGGLVAQANTDGALLHVRRPQLVSQLIAQGCIAGLNRRICLMGPLLELIGGVFARLAQIAREEGVGAELAVRTVVGVLAIAARAVVQLVHDLDVAEVLPLVGKLRKSVYGG